MFCKKSVLTNFAKFTGKHLAQVFSCKICKVSKNTFSYKTPALAASEHTNIVLTGTRHNIQIFPLQFSPCTIFSFVQCEVENERNEKKTKWKEMERKQKKFPTCCKDCGIIKNRVSKQT